jgi:hypothetical protein
MQRHVKRRQPAAPGSIPAVLRMFESEVRFYREIAPEVGVRVPACYQAEVSDEGMLLVLDVMPSTVVQGFLSMPDWPEGSDEAEGWNARLAAAAAMLTTGAR